MEASAKNLLRIIQEKNQYVIPIYQRTYSWLRDHCAQLLKDIQNTADSDKGHFVGSVVYFQPTVNKVADINTCLVIDGQQRLTTITLIIAALVKFLEEHPDTKIEGTTSKKLKNYYLFNAEEETEFYYKLLLTKGDKETLKCILTGQPEPTENSTRISENFKYFRGQISKENANNIYKGLQKLIIVNVALERDKDSPQLIFESLNSTGLDLSQSDLIRNYIMMEQESNFQQKLYEHYWYPMEQIFGDHINKLPSFIRDYLTMKQGAIPKIGDVYSTFKRAFNNQNHTETENIAKELYRYSQFYARLALHQEPDTSLLNIFKAISKLQMDVSYPFLLAVYGDFEKKVISIDEFKEILNITKNYVFRRAICGLPPNSLNKTFANLYKQITRENYLESVKSAFLLMDGYRRFPDDAEFEREIQSKDVYNFRSKNYLLESLENHNKKEPIDTGNYTIEHILPQNPKVSEEWKKELGEDWKNIKEKYLHTLGNLTLTGYNTELSVKPFKDKKTIEGGFNESPLFLNQSVREVEIWNEKAINSRANNLAKRSVVVWTRPNLSEEILNGYRKPKDEDQYTIEQYKHLKDDMLDLYQNFEKRVRNIDSSVKIEFTKNYIAFKAQTNFVDVEPQKKRLRLSLNVDFDQIKDTKSICRDISNLGRWGNGNVEVGLQNFSELDYAIDLVEQSFEEQFN